MPEPRLAILNTAPKWLKGLSDQTIRNRFWLTYLQNEGRILFSQGGVACNWLVKARQPQSINIASGTGVVYTQLDAHESLTVPVAGIATTQALELKIKMMNKDPLAIVDLAEEAIKSATVSTGNRLSAELYIRNTGNENQLVGLDTPFVLDGSVVTSDMIGLPSTTAAYGGKLVRPGSYGGTWSSALAASARPSSLLTTDWPLGSGSSDYDFIAPKALNFQSSRWGTGGTTWLDNCEHLVRRAKNWIGNLGGLSRVPTLHLLSQRLFDEFQDRQTVATRLSISDYGKSLGFGDMVLNYGGAMICPDFDCPSDTGYAINANEISLFSLHDDLFWIEGPNFNNTSLADEILVGFYGNLRFNPKYVAKYVGF